MQITPQQLGKYVGIAAVVVIVLIGAGFGIAAIVHEATKERPHFTTGKIVYKNFEPAHSEERSRQVYAGEDCHYSNTLKADTCDPIWRTEWYDVWIPDYYSIQIENCNVSHKDGSPWLDKQGNNKCFKKWVTLDAIAFHAVKINQDWMGS